MDCQKPLISTPDGKLIIRVAETKEDLEASYRLRYIVYCLKIKTENPERFPNQEEKDEFDNYSTVLLVFYEKELIGMVRLVPDTPHGFYSEKQFPLPANIDRSKVMEVSRVISDPPGILKRKLAEMKIRVGILLYKASAIWALQNGFTHLYSAYRIESYKHMKREGWRFQELAKNPQEYKTGIGILAVMPFILDIQNSKNTPFPYPVDENGIIHFPEK